MDQREILMAVAIFVNGAKDQSALQLPRDLDCHKKTAFGLTHKLREASSAEVATHAAPGVVEVDGAYFGGHILLENSKKGRFDRRNVMHQTGKGCVVVVARERGGRTFSFVSKTERRPSLSSQPASQWD